MPCVVTERRPAGWEEEIAANRVFECAIFSGTDWPDGRRRAHGRALRGLGLLYLAPALLLTGATTIRAGVGVWITAGPYWGQVFALAIDPVTPTTVYTGTGETSRMFKSTDAGAHWADTGSPFFMGAWRRSIPPPRPVHPTHEGEQNHARSASDR